MTFYITGHKIEIWKWWFNHTEPMFSGGVDGFSSINGKTQMSGYYRILLLFSTFNGHR